MDTTRKRTEFTLVFAELTFFLFFSGGGDLQRPRNAAMAPPRRMLDDVGQASLHTMDSDALATLALAIGRTSDAAVLKRRADTMRRLISANLWDDAASVFTNKKPNGSFLPRISPTSFYPLIVKAATPDQVARTSTAWLLNSTRF